MMDCEHADAESIGRFKVKREVWDCKNPKPCQDKLFYGRSVFCKRSPAFESIIRNELKKVVK